METTVAPTEPILPKQARVFQTKRITRLPHDGITRGSQTGTVNLADLEEYVGRVPRETLEAIIDAVNRLMQPRSAEDDKPGVD